ncbi:hypothetical protein BCR34DRAFT_154913 [Clohesyomyces aquaticus]|uniref:Uncharacterized protein n=1 Tax=Clohesyomyces aquaticus TaxID=1231657 RepID=A0A1Y2A029_9PLEO|nr:hypothetical protein BCR34DRAFT_154913 [Clohesyomyces aquaticus]
MCDCQSHEKFRSKQNTVQLNPVENSSSAGSQSGGCYGEPLSSSRATPLHLLHPSSIHLLSSQLEPLQHPIHYSPHRNVPHWHSDESVYIIEALRARSRRWAEAAATTIEHATSRYPTQNTHPADDHCRIQAVKVQRSPEQTGIVCAFEKSPLKPPTFYTDRAISASLWHASLSDRATPRHSHHEFWTHADTGPGRVESRTSIGLRHGTLRCASAAPGLTLDFEGSFYPFFAVSFALDCLLLCRPQCRQGFPKTQAPSRTEGPPLRWKHVRPSRY